MSREASSETRVDASTQAARMVAEDSRVAERQITIADLAVQGGMAAFCATGAASLAAAAAPVTVAVGAFAVLGAIRLRLSREKAPSDRITYLSIAADFLLFYTLILIFHWRIWQPPELLLEAPAFVFVFVLIALRGLRLEVRHIIFAGGVAALGWAMVTAIALLTAGASLDPAKLGMHIAIQAEKIIAIGLATGVMAIGVHRGAAHLRRAAIEQVRVKDALAREVLLNEQLRAESEARKTANEKLFQAANFDPLTGLENRRAFARRAAIATAGFAADTRRRFAIAIVDLNRFRSFNDGFGRTVGDALIRQSARRLESVLEEGEHLARVGADEFAVLSPCTDSRPCAERLGERLMAAFREPLIAEWYVFIGGVSVGVAAAEPEDRGGCVFAYADIALNDAKRRGGGSVRVHDPASRNGVTERAALELLLRNAPARGEMRLHYQPVFRLTDMQLAGWEALVRWERDAGRLISPAAFIPIAEETGAIVEIGSWALDAAARDAVRFAAAGAAPDAFMNVNVSPRQFDDPDALKTAVARALSLHTGLKLEVTESAIVEDPVASLSLLGDLRRSGAALALDDFGTGASSLSQLRRFPFSTLKIDQSFVRDDSPGGRAYLGAIVGLARALGLDTVAEGVETDDDLRACRALGVGYAQGYLLGRPQSADAVLSGLGASRPGVIAA